MSEDFFAEMETMEEAWKTGKDASLGVPAGQYNLQLLKVTPGKTKSADDPRISRQWVVLDGDMEGRSVYDQMMMNFDSNEYAAKFFAIWLGRMNYDVPESASGIKDVIEKINDEQPCVVAEVKPSGDKGQFTNVNVISLFEQTSPASAPEKAKPKPTPKIKHDFILGDRVGHDDPEDKEITYGDIFGFVEHEGSACIKIRDDEGGEFIVPISECTKTSPSDDSEVLAALLTIAQEFEEYLERAATDQDDISSISELLKTTPWDDSEVDADQAKVLKVAGIKVKKAK